MSPKELLEGCRRVVARAAGAGADTEQALITVKMPGRAGTSRFRSFTEGGPRGRVVGVGRERGRPMTAVAFRAVELIRFLEREMPELAVAPRAALGEDGGSRARTLGEGL